MTYTKKKKYLGYLLLLPALLTVTSIIIYPIILTFNISLQRYSLGKNKVSQFIAFNNYAKLFASSEFWNAFRISVMFTLLVTITIFVISLGISLLLNRNFIGKAPARILIVLPWAVPAVVAAIIWRWIFNASFGILNYLLFKIGIINEMIPWLADSTFSFIAVVINLFWKGYPLVVLMLLAALQTIPKDLYDSAKVDGANQWERFIYITLPGITQIIMIALILTTVWVFREFATVYVLTGGGPARATETLGLLVYKAAFEYLDYGYASALGIITLIVCAAFSIILMYAYKKSEI